MQAPRVCVGVDVAKRHLDVAVAGRCERVPNDESGVARVERLAREHAAALVVVEATGGYETLCVATLDAHGAPVVRVNPRQVRDFARATGLLAKTDRLDALVLAEFGERLDPPRRPLPDERLAELREVVARRGQLVAMATDERNRLALVRGDAALGSGRELVEHLRGQIAKLDAAARELLRRVDDWKERMAVLTSVPGVGPVIGATLVAFLPELGALDRKKIAALAGLAPQADDSGARQGPRRIRGGRGRVRTALYMGAMVARRHNPAIREMALRLERSGKKPKVILAACMRRLLVILNAMARTNQPWNPKEIHA